MTPVFAKQLGEALKTQRNLRMINLNDTLLEDSGVEVRFIFIVHTELLS